MKFLDHLVNPAFLHIFFFSIAAGVVFSQPPPDFVDDNSYTQDITERNEMKKLDMGFIYQSTKTSYQSEYIYDRTAFFVPAFVYEASENLINSKRMNMKFIANYCYYELKNDYGRYDDGYLEIELTANVKKYFAELFMGGGLYTYNYLSNYEFISLSFDLMLGYDTQTEYVSLLTPDKTYKEGFYSELVLRKNFYYNDSDFDPSTLSAVSGYTWADGSYYFVNSISGKLEIPVGDDEYTKFFVSNDFRIDMTRQINLGMFLDTEILTNDYATKSEFNIKPAITYFFQRFYLQPFYNFEYQTYKEKGYSFESTRENSTLGFKIALYWQE